MPNLTPTSSFDDVPELETSTLVLGGPGGPMNLPAQALLNRTQWLKDNAAAGSAGPYAAGSGTANACAATFTPPITATSDGLKIRFTAAAANTGPATFAPDTLTASPILGQAGLALQGGEIAANGEVEVTWNTTLAAWVMTGCSGGTVQVADATASHHAASKGQLDAVSTVANAAAPSADLASSAAGKGASLVYDAAKASDLASTATGKGASLVGFLQAGTGAVSRTVQDKSRERVSVKDFGARGDATTDDTAAIQAAVTYAGTLTSGATVYAPTGLYVLTDKITVPDNVYLVGSGRRSCQLLVNVATFNASATAVVSLGRETSFRNIGITFDQSAATSRATITQYPPGILIDGSVTQKDHVLIDKVRMSGAWDGISAPGNTGGNRYLNLELGCAHVALSIGAALDSVYIDNMHVWPFGHNTSYWSTGIGSGLRPTALNVDRCDGLNVKNLLAYKSQVILSGGFGHLTGLSLDTEYASLYVSGGEWTCASLYKTGNVGADDGIAVTGGLLTVSSFNLTRGNGTVGNYGSLCYVSGGTLAMTNGHIKCYGAGSVWKAAGSSSVLKVDGIAVDPSMAGSNLPNGIVYVSATTSASQVSISKISMPPKGGAVSGYLVILDPACSANVNITDNDFNGWSVNYNGIASKLANNLNMVDGDKIDPSGFVSIRPFIRKFTGTADGSGNLALAISSSVGTAVSNGRLLALQCFKVSGSSLLPVTPSSISTAAINLSGLGASASVIAYVHYV